MICCSSGSGSGFGKVFGFGTGSDSGSGSRQYLARISKNKAQNLAFLISESWPLILDFFDFFITFYVGSGSKTGSGAVMHYVPVPLRQKVSSSVSGSKALQVTRVFSYATLWILACCQQLWLEGMPAQLVYGVSVTLTHKKMYFYQNIFKKSCTEQVKYNIAI
jgi:hypothetical protein